MARKNFYLDTNRLVFLASLALAISVIILDNHFIYTTMIKSKSYILLRENIRSFKSISLVKYKTQYNEDNFSNSVEDSIYLRMGRISGSAYLDESTIIALNGSNRLNKMKNFLNIYRNSSKQSNTVILGDLIHEFLGSQIDTLFVPFTTKDYCFDFAQTYWCQIHSLSWFIYPITVERFDDYPRQLNENQYKSIKHNFATVEGSDNTLINVPIANPDGKRQSYYLFSYENEIFVYPLSYILSG